jgi:16S rRNA (uracil1498-N3)-methyltransferase
MHRFFVPPGQCQGDAVILGGREAHHALRVLRVRRGDRVVVLDGAGGQFDCEVENYDRDKVKLRVLGRRQLGAPGVRLTLIQALPKGKLFESIVQKATELGAHRLVPLISERVVAQLNLREAKTKTEKWRLVAIEAMKQSGSPWLPLVEAPLTPAQVLARSEQYDLCFLGSLQPEAAHPRSWFESFRAREGRSPQTVCFWIGPEGDFTQEEIAAIQSAGALPITLGPRVLRTETAAVYCLSIAQYELQWNPRG